MMTWRPTPISDEDAFAAIKAGIDGVPPGAKMILNSGQWSFHLISSDPPNSPHALGEFYGQDFSAVNIELVARFFEKYPDYADRVFLSVKGGLLPEQLAVDGSRENLRRSVDDILKALRGTKKLDLFEPARRDPNYEIEHYAEVLNELVKEGKFDYIGLSEVGAETVRRAHKVCEGFSFFLFAGLPDCPCARESLIVRIGYACRCGRDRSKPSGIRAANQRW